MTISEGRGRPYWAAFVGLATVVVVIDQVTKAWLVSILGPGERQVILGDLLRIMHGQNSGALFGLFKDQAFLFGLVSLGVVGLIVWYHGNSGRSALLTLALGLLLGGAIGNMIDRFRLGHVVDWVDIGVGEWRFYTFNVADAAISGAILLLLLSAVLPMLPGRGSAPTAAAETGPSAPAAPMDSVDG